MLMSPEARRVRDILTEQPGLRDMDPFDMDELAAKLCSEAFLAHDCDDFMEDQW